MWCKGTTKKRKLSREKGKNTCEGLWFNFFYDLRRLISLFSLLFSRLKALPLQAE